MPVVADLPSRKAPKTADEVDRALPSIALRSGGFSVPHASRYQSVPPAGRILRRRLPTMLTVPPTDLGAWRVNPPSRFQVLSAAADRRTQANVSSGLAGETLPFGVLMRVSHNR
jgi:hypothetical protein